MNDYYAGTKNVMQERVELDEVKRAKGDLVGKPGVVNKVGNHFIVGINDRTLITKP